MRRAGLVVNPAKFHDLRRLRTDVDAVFDELIETIGAFARSRAPEIVGTAPEESTGLL